jgi:hypothetical protein
LINIDARLIKDVDAFIQEGLISVADKGKDSSQERARMVSFKGEMEKGINKVVLSPYNVQVVSGTEQGHRFETGYSGVEQITPLIKEWADHVGTRLKPNAKTINVNYKDTRFRVDTYEFIRRSIPTEAQVKAELDRTIVKTIRGGTV